MKMLFAGLAALFVVGPDRIATESPRPAPHSRRVPDVSKYPIADGKGTAAILFDAAAGSPEAAMTLLSLSPGAMVPEHVHESSTEFVFVLEGESEMTLGQGAQREVVRLGPMSAARIPMKTPHSARVVGDGTFRALQIYTPAGPEQRFKGSGVPVR